jgi:hypothetical protein
MEVTGKTRFPGAPLVDNKTEAVASPEPFLDRKPKDSKPERSNLVQSSTRFVRVPVDP